MNVQSWLPWVTGSLGILLAGLIIYIRKLSKDNQAYQAKGYAIGYADADEKCKHNIKKLTDYIERLQKLIKPDDITNIDLG